MCFNKYILNFIEQTKIFRKCFRLDYCSVIYHAISISTYNPLTGTSYIKLRKELEHPRK